MRYRKTIVIVGVLLFLFGAITLIESKEYGIPFQGVWDKIYEHDERITDLEEQPSVAGVKIYDDNEQYVGLLLSHEYGDVAVYVPSLESIITLDNSSGKCLEGYLYFQSDNCQGTPYIKSGHGFYQILKVVDKYYTGTRIAPVQIIVHSELYPEGRCVRYDAELSTVPAEDVTDDMPFIMPVSLPFHFE